MLRKFRLFLTKKGNIGKGEYDLEEGDIVCILLGCAMPMILRPVDGHYELIREAYVAGIMRKIAMTALREGRKVLREFEIH
jgi:hypothetical protein